MELPEGKRAWPPPLPHDLTFCHFFGYPAVRSASYVPAAPPSKHSKKLREAHLQLSADSVHSIAHDIQSLLRPSLPEAV